MSTRYQAIRKVPGGVAHNLGDYDSARARFTWQGARPALDGLPNGAGLNIAHEAVDRHVARGRGERLAIRWLGKNGVTRDRWTS
jgi:acetyl-CoA synthetase